MPATFSKPRRVATVRLSANELRQLKEINRIRPVMVFIVPRDPNKRKTFISGRSVSQGLTLKEFLQLMKTDWANDVAEVHVIEQAEYVPGLQHFWAYVSKDLDTVSCFCPCMMLF